MECSDGDDDLSLRLSTFFVVLYVRKLSAQVCVNTCYIEIHVHKKSRAYK